MCTRCLGESNLPRRHLGLVRKGGLVIPKGREGDDDISEDEVRDVARSHWEEEIAGLEDFLISREDASGYAVENAKLSGGGPLKEVQAVLEGM